jgi:hypothetical protein|tara:strand:- start:54 stop:239 length:186 start_codon:yes stop_codon:yes gene_type:complete
MGSIRDNETIKENEMKYATMILDGQEVRTQFRAEHLQQIDGQWFFVTKMRQIKVWNISENY